MHPNNSWKIAERTGLYHPVDPNPARRVFLNWLEGYLTQKAIKDREDLESHSYRPVAVSSSSFGRVVKKQ